MFEEYLQDSYYFFSTATELTARKREARRYFRASVFYASGAMEAFVNYLADSFEKAGSLSPHEICFLNDRMLVFSPTKGLAEKSAYQPIDGKVRLLIRKFVAGFDFEGITWIRFMEFKTFRDSLVHPRQSEDDTPLSDYEKKVRAGLKAIIELMNLLSKGIFGQPLRKQLLDLIPE